MTARPLAARLARLETLRRVNDDERLTVITMQPGESEAEAVERLYPDGPGPRGVVVFLTPDDAKL
jgi:hypothetical protein